MPTKILMPQLGESVVDGTVGEWLKKVGDTVEEFEPIVRVSTDKVDTEIPAPASGVLLEIYIPEGDVVLAGVELGLIGETGENTGSNSGNKQASNGHHASVAAPVAVAAVRAKEPVPAADMGHVTPVVARMAREHGLDLSKIKGTGRDGRIRKKDVEAFLATGGTVEKELAPWEIPADGDLFKPSVNYEDDIPAPKAAPQPQAAPTPAPAASSPAPRPAAKPAPVPQGVPGELVALSNIRRSIAQHMVESKLHIAPHVTTVMEADLQAITEHRKANKADFAKQGVNLTFTPYFVMAVAKALQTVPVLNARWTDEGLFYNHIQNIGMAVAIDDGLIVPVIKNAGDYNLLGLARMVNDLAERARNRQLKPDEVTGGTFTITNHGVSGSIVATPIINQPQSGILGVGMIEKRVKVINDAIAIRPCSYLSLTFDHRVADGATADAFLMAVKQTLENWS
jgi:pyruvate/2-oxoglutarate dehydrogenase complex dihydrolipoamide acyltransferase (E2) component